MLDVSRIAIDGPKKSARMITEEYIKKNFTGVEYDQRMFLSWVFFEKVKNA